MYMYKQSESLTRYNYILSAPPDNSYARADKMVKIAHYRLVWNNLTSNIEANTFELPHYFTNRLRQGL